jgi:hypothetical protein
MTPLTENQVLSISQRAIKPLLDENLPRLVILLSNNQVQTLVCLSAQHRRLKAHFDIFNMNVSVVNDDWRIHIWRIYVSVGALMWMYQKSIRRAIDVWVINLYYHKETSDIYDISDQIDVWLCISASNWLMIDLFTWVVTVNGLFWVRPKLCDCVIWIKQQIRQNRRVLYNVYVVQIAKMEECCLSSWQAIIKRLLWDSSL